MPEFDQWGIPDVPREIKSEPDHLMLKSGPYSVQVIGGAGPVGLGCQVRGCGTTVILSEAQEEALYQWLKARHRAK